MLLSFPYMHSELNSNQFDEMMYFDPGLAEATRQCMFQPSHLPLDKSLATALINDSIRFGEQFKDPSEMAYFGAISSDDFYEGSSYSIQAQLSRQFDDGKGTKQEREQKEALARAQFVLLLSWFFEERMIELASIKDGIKQSWQSIDSTLGVIDSDRIESTVIDLGNIESHTGGLSDAQSVPLPWKRVVEALPAFIPKDTILVCADPAIHAVWEDWGIHFSEKSSLELSVPCPLATLPAWRFAGRRKAPQNMPHALEEITIALVK